MVLPIFPVSSFDILHFSCKFFFLLQKSLDPGVHNAYSHNPFLVLICSGKEAHDSEETASMDALKKPDRQKLCWNLPKERSWLLFLGVTDFWKGLCLHTVLRFWLSSRQGWGPWLLDSPTKYTALLWTPWGWDRKPGEATVQIKRTAGESRAWPHKGRAGKSFQHIHNTGDRTYPSGFWRLRV